MDLIHCPTCGTAVAITDPTVGPPRLEEILKPCCTRAVSAAMVILTAILAKNIAGRIIQNLDRAANDAVVDPDPKMRRAATKYRNMRGQDGS